MPNELTKMEAHIVSEDWKSVGAVAHSINSTSSYAGSLKLKTRLGNIENLSLKGEELEKIPAIAQEIREISKSVVNELKEYLDKIKTLN